MLLIEDHYNIWNIQITSQPVLIIRILVELIELYDYLYHEVDGLITSSLNDIFTEFVQLANVVIWDLHSAEIIY